jgi:RHS repeat-associated protein
VRVQGGLNTIDIRYEYDALNRRTRQLVTAGTAPSLDFYYNSEWKILEERIIDLNGAKDSPIRPTAPLPVTTKIRAQYIYGIRDRNDLIFRDYSADGATAPTRHYVLSDAMFSTTAIADSDGVIQQRFRYTAFGTVSYMMPDFTDTPANPVNWQILLHGEYYDEDTKWSNYGYRVYIPILGRWINRDPIEEKDDMNLYGFCKNDSLNKSDMQGKGVPGVIGGGALIIGIVWGCAKPQHAEAFERFPDSGDKFKHCWVSCRISKTCGGLVAELAGIGKEARDRLVGVYCSFFPEDELCKGGHGDFWDSLEDIAANQQCIGWETIAFGAIGGWIGSLFRRSCECCCREKVGYKNGES